jgi:hypothetical protein
MIYIELSAETEEALKAKIEKYLKRYPMKAYKTFVREIKFYNDKYTCIVSRENSSD